MGDFVKGRLDGRYPEGIKQGFYFTAKSIPSQVRIFILLEANDGSISLLGTTGEC